MWSEVPIKMFLDEELNEWFNKSEDIGVEELGLVKSPGAIHFSSANKEEVEHWTSGALAVMELLHDWVWAVCDEDRC